MNKIFYFFAFAGSINYASAQHIISIKNSDEKNPNKTLAAQLDSIYQAFKPANTRKIFADDEGSS